MFEGRTPRGFSPSDSTTTTTFVADEDVTILVDLNEAATQTYPVIANFQTLEKSVPFYSGAFQDSTTRYMSQAIAVDDFGFIHRAWIQQRGEVSSDEHDTGVRCGVREEREWREELPRHRLRVGNATGSI